VGKNSVDVPRARGKAVVNVKAIVRIADRRRKREFHDGLLLLGVEGVVAKCQLEHVPGTRKLQHRNNGQEYGK
jgi:hypothetical protein